MRTLIIAAVLAVSAGTATAGPIERACLRSDRDGVNPRVCGCIQQVANRWLDASDQRLAAGFFRDPDQAQAIRASDTPEHDAFWQRYTSFGSSAAAACMR
ncbi:MAG TPA: hypothetical protein DDY29_11375 [Rhodobacteraceae bacterium]|jgi:hypothetical protein|nr:hypothetical protein [Paracoccaceae bacterium]HBG99284.1 hypothetical protein [Paracoccaceae bacterium]